MRIQRERYFSIHSDNRPGELARITSILMESNVTCSGIWGFTTGGNKAEVIVVPQNASLFKETARSNGWDCTEGVCFHLEGKDKTGALVDILDRIASDGINMRAMDAIAVEGRFGCYIWVNENDLEHLAQVLGLSTPKP